MTENMWRLLSGQLVCIDLLQTFPKWNVEDSHMNRYAEPHNYQYVGFAYSVLGSNAFFFKYRNEEQEKIPIHEELEREFSKKIKLNACYF